MADGWAAPIAPYLPYERWAEANNRIDEAARAADREPAEVRRIAQLVGTITDEPVGPHRLQGDEPVHGDVDDWAHLLARLATEQPFRTFIFWPRHETADQLERFATQVVPAVRARLGATIQ